MIQGETALHQQTEEGTRDNVGSGDSDLGKEPASDPKVVCSSHSVPFPDGVVSGVVPTQLGNVGV